MRKLVRRIANMQSLRFAYLVERVGNIDIKYLESDEINTSLSVAVWFASRLVLEQVDLYTVKELMGHSTVQMTERYAHLAPQHKASNLAVYLEQNRDRVKRSD